MHLIISLYLILYVIIFSFNAYIAFTLGLLTIMLQWFYGITKITKTDRGAFQYCTSCKKLTLQHYIHCYQCNKCVPADLRHDYIMNTCTTDHNLKRYKYLLLMIMVYIGIILAIYGMINGWYWLGLILHIMTIYWINKEKNINISVFM